MCGIVGIWEREGGFSPEAMDILFTGAEKRGRDAFGVVVWDGYDIKMKTFLSPYSKARERALEFVGGSGSGKRVILGICRAQPETEVKSEDANSVQPIVKDGLVLIHNGVVANFIYDELKDVCGYQSKIDSEAIINAYVKYNGDMKKVMETLVGGFAFILLDTKKKRMFCVNDFKPLAIGYIKGHGFLVHSDEAVLGEIVEAITDCKRCGTNVWEDYYYHWQDGYTIREIDLDSGMERLYNFRPNFYHPFWKKKKGGKELVLVCASGGIDSGLSAWIMKYLGYEVRLIHFDYAQKGEEVERFAVEQLAERHKFDCELINLRELFATDSSMLTRDDIPVTTGTDKYIKTTAAWVSNRNGVFMSWLACRAEQLILSNAYDKVYIVSGMSNLSESGFYPDNSEYFIKSFFESLKYSTIVGDRIKYVPLLQNIMKFEEWFLGEALGFPFELTVSCDNARLGGGLTEPNYIELCNQCGSTQLSKWAAELAGVRDPRKFYDIDDTVLMEKKVSGKNEGIDLFGILKRIQFIKEADLGTLERIFNDE